MENEKFITVLTVTFPYEIAVIRGRLEAEGISCFVKDELTVQVNPFYSNAIGGVKLQVLERDLKQAIEILKEMEYIKEENSQISEKSPHINEHSNNQNKKRSWYNLFCSWFKK